LRKELVESLYDSLLELAQIIQSTLLFEPHGQLAYFMIGVILELLDLFLHLAKIYLLKHLVVLPDLFSGLLWLLRNLIHVAVRLLVYGVEVLDAPVKLLNLFENILFKLIDGYGFHVSVELVLDLVNLDLDLGDMRLPWFVCLSGDKFVETLEPSDGFIKVICIFCFSLEIINLFHEVIADIVLQLFYADVVVF
jgi:hypothetical protein